MNLTAARRAGTNAGARFAEVRQWHAGRAMRYRHVRYRYAVVADTALRPVFRLSGIVLAQPRWRPETDVY